MQAREKVLAGIADAIEAGEREILDANALDMAAAKEAGTDEQLVQRLGMTPQKLKTLCSGIRSIASSDEPLRKASPFYGMRGPSSAC